VSIARLALLLPLLAAPAAAQTPTRFDGSWDVSVVCPATTDGVAGFTLRLVAQVQAGQLLGEFDGGAQGGRMRIEGPVRPDGVASLRVEGVTADPGRAPGRPSRATAYRYPAEARFIGSSGTGRGTDQRRCDLTFHRRR
jgi:hypothetical protein